MIVTLTNKVSGWNRVRSTGYLATLGAAIEGSRRPLVIASGLAGLTPGVLATEKDAPDSSSPAGSLRIAIGRARTSVVRRVTALTGDSSPKGDSLPNARTPQ